jgi:PleD family two-component response regulator
MILDDDYLSIDSGKIILSSIGFNVLSAMNTEECLKKLDTNQVAILFLDMMMIDMSGLEFLKLLRQNKKYDHIKVILVSGAYDVKEIQEAMSLGAIFYFTKPYNKSQILDGINNLAKELIQ